MARSGTNHKGGRPKGSLAPSTLKAIETKSAFVAEVEKNLRPIIDALLDKAASGDVTAIKELLDRAWGKPTQTIAGDKDNPVTVAVISYTDAGSHPA